MIIIKEELDNAEKLLKTNIARTIIDIEIHRNMDIKKLRLYYGKDFKEKDRQEIIEDTIRKSEWDRGLLEAFKKEKDNIIKNYTYDKIEKGDFRRIPKRRGGDSDK